MTKLSIPLVSPEDDLLSAALKYAAAGWYVGPGSPSDRKNPGRVLGKKWQTKTSRDRDTICEWFIGTDNLLFLHVGRSGAWVADVDDPEELPDVLTDAIERQCPPHQSSRPDQPGRGHWLFRQPDGREIGNSTGTLGKTWGEGRGRNGVIFVCPSSHKNEADGAVYEWLQTGDVPEMTPELAAALPDAANTDEPATDAEVAAFVAEHTSTVTPQAAKGTLSAFAKQVADGGSRHDALVHACCWAAREARAGVYAVGPVFDTLRQEFVTATTREPVGTERKLSTTTAKAEANTIVAWAVAQAKLVDLDELQERMRKHGLLPPLVSGQNGQDPAGEGEETCARRLVFRKASTIVPRPVRWAWDTAPDAEPRFREGRFPIGSLVIAVGRAGVGKSQFAAWVTARITTGTLPGAFYGEPRSVVYAATEDSWQMTIAPRLIAAGADLDRVYHISVQDDGNLHATLTLPSDTRLLEQGIHDHDVAVVVMDPLLSLLDSGINDYRAREVREALEPLVAVADRTQVLLLGLAHFTKATGNDPLMLVSGSAAFGQLVRSAVAFARDDEESDSGGGEAFVCSTIKNNLGREDLPSLAYRISPYCVDTPEGDAWVSRLEFTGEASERSVRDILRGAGADPEEKTERQSAADWLEDYLTGFDKTPSADVKKAAHAAGFSERTLARARAQLNIKVTSEGFPRVSYWSLPVDPHSRANGSGTTGGTTGDGTTGATIIDLHKQVSAGARNGQSCHIPVYGTTDQILAPLVTDGDADTWLVSGLPITDNDPEVS